MSKMKAVGMFVFAGSATIGTMNTGLFDVDRVLEITDEIIEQNAKHFIHNYPDIPVVVPSKWENDEYLYNLGKQEVDLLLGNPPCSSLSQINRNASVDGPANVHFYRVFNAVSKIRPKVFLLENAPTTIKLGYPILKDMINQLGEHYRFTIIRDRGANHGVSMQRTRTFIIGWRRDYFKHMPILEMNKKSMTTAWDAIGRFEGYEVGDESVVSHRLVPERHDAILEQFFGDVQQGCSIREHICRHWDEYVDKLDDKTVKSFATIKRKFDAGQNYWDKSPRRVHPHATFPSMSSVANFIHPTKDRPLTVREYAAIMNYPDNFEFVEDAKVPVVQAIAQGVPANFFEYIANEVGQALLGNRAILPTDDTVVVFQNHINGLYRMYNLDEIQEATCFEVSKKDAKVGNLLK